MPVETSTDVEQLSSVEDAEGNQQPPANEGQQDRIAESLENHTGLKQIEVTTESADTAEALPAHTVPEGVTVLVEYREANSGNVYVGDANTQMSPLAQVGDFRSFPVTDTSLIHIRTPTAGDGAIVTFEVDG